MKLVRFVLLLLLLVPHRGFAGEPSPQIYMQRGIAWEDTPRGYQAGSGAVLMLDSRHHYLKLFAQFYRDDKNSAPWLDIKSGYVVWAGQWEGDNGERIRISYRVVDRYQYFTMDKDAPSEVGSGTFRLVGKTWGVLTESLLEGDEQYRRAGNLGGQEVLMRFWNRFVEKAN